VREIFSNECEPGTIEAAGSTDSLCQRLLPSIMVMEGNMDVLLVDPPQMTLKGQVTTRGYNLGLTSLAAYLRKEGIDTGILMGDLSVEVPSGNIIKSILPDWLTISTKDLALGQNTLEKIAKDTNHQIWKTIADKVRQIMPAALGISYYTPLKPVEDLIVNLVKDVNQDIKIIAGSFHATFCPDELMQNPDIDFVVRGEGEIPLASLIKEIKKDRPKWENIPGILYRDLDGQIKSNPSVGMIDNLDDLPFPARDLVLECDYHRYNHHSLITARGCPYSCAFCGDKRLWGGTVRRRSVDNVIEEIKLLKDTYKIKYV
jgi:hypothetical protein